MACSKGDGPGVLKATAGSCNEELDADGAAAGAKASPWTAKGSELTLGADGGWPNGSENPEPFDEIEGAAGAAKGSAPLENDEATLGALGAPSKDDATEDTDGGAGGAPKGSGVAGAGGTEPLRRCGLAWAGEALGSVDELLRVPSPLAAKRLRAAGGCAGLTRPGPDVLDATDGTEAVPKGSEKALEVEGAGAGADHSAWRRRAISSSVSLGFDALGGGFGGSSSSSDDASELPSSEDDEDSAGFGERTVRTEGFGADSAVASEGADRRGRNDAGGDAPEPERRRTVAETSSTRSASAL
mmetsp:Transcript_951/g.2696  ORF Transcript_951/g.2696 Transcript_951/m.2696 type:complete len:300 (-) Transcript_951:2610-3509(-)